MDALASSPMDARAASFGILGFGSSWMLVSVVAQKLREEFIANGLDQYKEFHASSGWFQSLRKREGITTSKKVFGEWGC